MTTVRTTNWETMIRFYCQVLGMQADNAGFRHLVRLRGFGSEICLERVEDESEKEVLGHLEFETDLPGCERLVKNRNGARFELELVDRFTVVVRDPDNNRVCVKQWGAIQGAA